jgi:NAD(P)-dependent dehydrogenase (short-subunit alcohol dehydrogenase family)
MSESEREPLEDLTPLPGGLLEGRRGLVIGVANFRSIAWGIARNARRHGAELAFTFQGEALERRVRPLAASVGSELVLPLDVTRDQEIEAVFEQVREKWGGLDFLVHSIAFAEKEDLSGRTIDTSRAGFAKALDISAYSLIALARAAEPLLRPGGSIVAMTYYGSTKVLPSYNVMGIARPRSRPPCATWRRTSAPRASASTPSPPARSRPWRRRGVRPARLHGGRRRARAAAAQRHHRGRRQGRCVSALGPRERRHRRGPLRRRRLFYNDNVAGAGLLQ